MSKAVLISIQPKWCELIASGKKTIEVRKTKPKLETPFKCYIYCTKDNIDSSPKRVWWKSDKSGYRHIMNGKVIGEFMCDEVESIDVPYPAYSDKLDKRIIEQSQVPYYALHKYAYHDTIYGWHISDLVIYDKPKELSHFTKSCDRKTCEGCECLDIAEIGAYEHTAILKTCLNRVTRPPQSWRYVEELHDE